MSRIVLFKDLTKTNLCLMVSVSAVFGSFLAKNEFSFLSIVPIFFGVLFLSMGSCALNEVQERNLDALFERTRHRPIPSGHISPERATAIAAALMSLGLFLVVVASTGWEALWASLLAVFLYNAVYTPLKRVTSLSVIPGALSGAMPVLIGAMSQGWHATSSPEVWLAVLMQTVWQVPHTWLILLLYHKQYQLQPKIFPTILSLLSVEKVRWLVVCWVLLYAFSTLLLASSLPLSPFFVIALTVNMVAVVGSVIYYMLARMASSDFLPPFIHINVSLLLTMLFIFSGVFHISVFH